jgi:hypothetical protein
MQDIHRETQQLASRNLNLDGILGLIDRHTSLTHW